MIQLIKWRVKSVIFDFAKIGNKSTLGGEVHRANRRKRNIIQALLFLIAFVLLNLVLYYLTKV